MNILMQWWDGVVESAAVIVMVVTAIGMMAGLVELSHAVKRVALALVCMMVLLIMPPIMVGIWRSLTLWQHLGLIVLLAVILMFISVFRSRNTNAHKPKH